jgi:hypothetical protein
MFYFSYGKLGPGCPQTKTTFSFSISRKPTSTHSPPELGMASQSLKLNNGLITDESSISLTALSVEYQYGIFDNLSVGIATLYGQGTIDSGVVPEYDYNGLGDIFFITRGFWSHSEAKHLRFRYGFDFGYSPAQEVNSSGELTNLNSGRVRVTPYVGFDVDAGENGIFGAKLSREILIGKQQTNTPGGLTIESAGLEPTRATVFYEYQDNSFVSGATLFHEVTSDLDISGNLTPQIIQTGTQVYGVYHVTESIMLIPELSFGSTFSSRHNGNEIDSFSVFSANVGARFLL